MQRNLRAPLEEPFVQFMVLTRRSPAFADSAYTPARLEQEAQVVRGLYLEGAIRQIWHRGDAGGACMLMEGHSEDEIRRFLELLPLFAAGMQEVMTMVPLLPYRGFGPHRG